MSKAPTLCPSCGGCHLSHGRTTVSVAFIPDWWTIKRSIVTITMPFIAKRGFVCLDCGFIGNYLDARALEKVRTGGAPEPKAKRPLDEL